MRRRRIHLSLLLVLLAVSSAGARQNSRPSGSTPPERPRTRPPSTLTGLAEWEKANELLELARGTNRVVMRPDGPLRRELADVRLLRLVPVRRGGVK